MTAPIDAYFKRHETLASLGPPADEEHAIDSTIVRAHQDAAGVKGGIKTSKRSAARAVGSRPKSTSAHPSDQTMGGRARFSKQVDCANCATGNDLSASTLELVLKVRQAVPRKPGWGQMPILIKPLLFLTAFGDVTNAGELAAAGWRTEKGRDFVNPAQSLRIRLTSEVRKRNATPREAKIVPT
jgi:hypothetical protein